MYVVTCLVLADCCSAVTHKCSDCNLSSFVIGVRKDWSLAEGMAELHRNDPSYTFGPKHAHLQEPIVNITEIQGCNRE